MNKIKKILGIFLFFYIVNFCLGQTGARYLIFAPDSYVETLRPLAEWKTQKGIKTRIVPLSVSGNSASQIKNYILNGYNNWELRPEYILLAGHGSVVPYSGSSDDYFGDMTGDYKIELSVGRFPVTSVDQLANVVNKTLNYERYPYIEDSVWFKKGMTIIDEDYSGYPPTQYPDTEYWENARYCYTRWLDNHFVHVDSFSRNRGNNATNVINGINDGRSYIVYRGQTVGNWGSPFSVDPQSTTNGYKLPIIVSATCATSSLYYNEYQGNRFINAGTATNPKGAVGFFATTVTAVGSGLAQQRGTVAKGFHRALFDERIYTMGDAAKRAKFLLDSIRPPGFSQTRYTEWQLLGDPSLQMWTDRPVCLTAVYDSVIYSVPQNFIVNIRTGTYPVPGASVCIMMDSTIYQHAYTNSSGEVTFVIHPQVTGIMSVTVTAHNMIPYQGNVRINSGNFDHDIGLTAIIEPIGNIAAGTNVIPRVKVKNYGANTDTFSTTIIIGSDYNATDSFQILSSGDTNIISLPNWTAIAGTHQVTAFVCSDNDEYSGNDTIHTIINVLSPNDVGVDAIISPDSSVMLNQMVTPRVRIKNYGTANQINFPVVCSIISENGTVRYTDTQIISTLIGGDTVIVSFNNWTSNIAEQCTVKVRTNLVADQNPNNDVQSRVVQVVMMMIAEGFNNASFPPNGWQAQIVTGSQNWEWASSGTQPTCTPYEGLGMITYQSWFASSGSSARLITPMIPVNGTIRCSLKFAMLHDNGYASYNDQVQVQTSLNGINFNPVETFYRYAPSESWTEHTIYLGEFTSNFYIGFHAVSAYGNNMYLDYIRLFSPTALNEIENITLPTMTMTSLYAPKPNPIVNGIVYFSFNLAEPAQVLMRVYDASGKLVKTLLNTQMSSGMHSLNWNCNDNSNQKIGEGVYFYTLETPKEKLTKKLVLTR
jgi:hypothetical protein